MKLKRITALVCALSLAAGAAGVPAVRDVFGVDASISANADSDAEPTVFRFPDLNMEQKDTLMIDLALIISDITAEQAADTHVTIDDPSVVSYTIEGTEICFAGLKEGSTKITIESPSPEYVFSSFTITVSPSFDPIILEGIYSPHQTVTEGMSLVYDLSDYDDINLPPDIYFKPLDPDIAEVYLSEDNKLYFNGIHAGNTEVRICYNSNIIGVYYVTVKAAIPGDIDGSGSETPDIDDLVLLQKKVAGWKLDNSKFSEKAADLDGDEDFDVDDLILLQKKVAGWNVEFVKKSQ